MTTRIRRVEYFNTSVRDEPGNAYGLLARLEETGVNLLAFSGFPTGTSGTQLSLFPEDARLMEDVARKIGMDLDGPHPALLVQGDDELGALATIHSKLNESGIDVFASTGLVDGRGSYGYLLYVRPEDIDGAAAALEI